MPKFQRKFGALEQVNAMSKAHTTKNQACHVHSL